jgi:hypothetical protein
MKGSPLDCHGLRNHCQTYASKIVAGYQIVAIRLALSRTDQLRVNHGKP